MTPSEWLSKALWKGFRHLFLRGLFEFRVVTEQSGRITLQPVRAKWLSDIPLCEQWTAPGMAADAQEGSSVLIAFVDADETRPAIVSFMPIGYTIGKPLKLTIDADEINAGAAAAPVIRSGDTVGITPGNGSGPVSGIISITLGTAESPPAPSRLKA